ncbi:MAG: flagellar hook-basal body complex protein FliE [Pseudomonadota bacterium]|jgi:flagellar hook-basal body complex protein FliE
MSIGPLNGFAPFAGMIRPDAPQAPAAAPARSGVTGFGARVAGAIDDLAAAQAKAAESAKAFEMGLETDLASVMVDQQISSLGFQFALNVRNKALGAYRDIMNMPV